MVSAEDTPSLPLAVALKYDAKRDDAPRVTATGRGMIAEQILNIAFAQGVKVRQDAPLAEILSMIEVDSLIPLEAYAAVAEILTYVYRANATEARIKHAASSQDSVRMPPPNDLLEQ